MDDGEGRKRDMALFFLPVVIFPVFRTTHPAPAGSRVELLVLIMSTLYALPLKHYFEKIPAAKTSNPLNPRLTSSHRVVHVAPGSIHETRFPCVANRSLEAHQAVTYIITE